MQQEGYFNDIDITPEGVVISSSTDSNHVDGQSITVNVTTERGEETAFHRRMRRENINNNTLSEIGHNEPVIIDKKMKRVLANRAAARKSKNKKKKLIKSLEDSVAKKAAEEVELRREIADLQTETESLMAQLGCDMSVLESIYPWLYSFSDPTVNLKHINRM